ncbi:D-Ala-D-Ala carboxypeptidase family metallohydrolase [Thalassobius sp. Cn5-15]|uniref:YcbK family protein n=1 Tax=Thalassobius sp. Cn5-15 TaxID=2917763 RepID=UPI001EF1EB73|nr:D-Ala-D-Ala carboxypeptidase family metallohydrolase [Thalassobius sp. Cn5-15]MCG7492457.1 D-Ala-D-Ala carboxypeptidase family metallohydrolase [Thalassobius sp. Cn5-15]
MLTIYPHWSEFPMSEWRWKDFSPQEMACRGTGRLAIHPPSMDKLQALRDRLGRPVIVNSAFRSDEHNRRVGGAKGSFHKKAQAYDVRMDNHDPWVFREAAEAVGFTGFGGYPKQGFMHIDTGPKREWGKWWHAGRHATGLPLEQDHPKPAAKDKGVQGVSALIAAPVVREASGVLKDTGGFLEGLHPVAQTASVVLIGIGVGLLIWKWLESR